MILGTVVDVAFPIIKYYKPTFNFDKNLWALGIALLSILFVTFIERVILKKENQ